MYKPNFKPGVDLSRQPEVDSFCFVFRKGEVLLGPGAVPSCLPRFGEVPTVVSDSVRSLYFGELAGQSCFASEVEEASPEPGHFRYCPLRAAYGPLDEPTWVVAGRAAQILEWDRTHRFCGRCGDRTEHSDRERARICPSCGLVAFPRVSPAMIVLVERGDEVLLARGKQHGPGMYALVAGFVETGESLEDAVRREVMEEVGIEVRDITYFGSQPWPFPHSIMVGFTAQYASGEIRIDPDEIEDAQWFNRATMPPVPPRLSIARKLIDYYADKHSLTLTER